MTNDRSDGMSDAVVWKTRDPYYGLGPQGLRKRLRADPSPGFWASVVASLERIL